MNDLERQLVDLGSALEVPATPDLMTEVIGRLRTRPARGRGRALLQSRRGGVLALALGVMLAGTAAAVPPVRHEIERVIGLRGAVVERVPKLSPPPAGASRPSDLGRRIPVADARHAASFRALLPPRRVDAAYVSGDVAGGRITLVVGKLLVMEFRGQSSPYVLKIIGPSTRTRNVRVASGRGIYLDGAPHEMFFMDARGMVRTDTLRLGGNVLLWQQGPLILRIEGSSSLASALALARSLN
jgi:hypothetical protein